MDHDKFANDIIRHTIASQSYDAGEAAKITRMLNATIEDMKAELAVRYTKAQAKGVDRGPATTKRIEEMIAGLESLNREVYGKIGKTMEDGLVDRARHEMQFVRDANKKAGGVNLGTTLPDANYLRTLVNHTPIPLDPDTSTLLKPWLRDMERNNLDRLNRVVQSALITGKTPAELGDLLEKGGFAKSRASAQALAITANSAVANAARLETFKKMRGVTHVEWSSILDTRTTAGCQALSGKIFAIDDPALPPCPRHIRCFPGDTLVEMGGDITSSGGATTINNIRGVSRHWFDGNLIVIRTASGKSLRGTPNHPILTRRGWVALCDLEVGDEAVGYISIKRESIINDDHVNGPSAIHEIAEAFGRHGEMLSRKVPVTAEDFHGDVVDGDVAVIFSDPLLTDERDIIEYQNSAKEAFIARRRSSSHLFSGGNAHRFVMSDLTSSYSFVGRLRQRLSILKTGASHSSLLLFATIASRDASIVKGTRDHLFGDVHNFTDSSDADSVIKEAAGFFDIDHDLLSACVDSSLSHGLVKRRHADVELSSAIRNGHTGAVEFDCIVEKGLIDFSGHVYNLDTVGGFYQAQGLVVHNCRSTYLPRKNDTDPPLHKPYPEWLKAQNAKVQDEVLGKARGGMFRDGTITDADLYRDDGTFRTLDELKRADANIVAPGPTAKRFTSPAKVDLADIRVQPRKDVTKALTSDLAQAAKDARYDPRPEFKGIKEADLGKATLSSGFTDPAASMIAALKPELDQMADALGIPRLRSVKTGNGKYIATMGDGTLTVNPTYFNGYAAILSGEEGGSAAAKIVAQRDAVAAELTEMKAKIEAAKAVARDATGATRDAAILEYVDLADAFNAKRQDWLKLDKKVLAARRTDAASSKPVSTWKPGDEVAARPYNTTDYFSGVDRARNVLYHEFAHHIHQMLGKRGRRSQVGKPPLEKHLAAMFFNKFNGAAPGNLGKGLEKKKLVASTYATTNEFEWWAENFALHMMGRHDLVEPELKELIERLLEDANDTK